MRILIAEDDPVIGLGLSERLRVLGHEPIGPVADGQLAVEAARASLPDLYLFDIDMPRLDGPKRTLPSTAGQLLLASGRSTRRDALETCRSRRRQAEGYSPSAGDRLLSPLSLKLDRVATVVFWRKCDKSPSTRIGRAKPVTRARGADEVGKGLLRAVGRMHPTERSG